MSYELVPIGELGEIVTGSTPDTTNRDYWDGDIPWITPANLTSHEGIYFTGELRKITKAGYKSCSTKMMPAGSIVFSTRAPIGHCAVTSFPLCTNQGFKSIVPNERLDAVYGFFALKYFTPQLEILGRGATFAEVNKETFENFRLPLPPLTEQKRTASLLARADRLRSLRRTGRALGESLLQSVFLEMFGNLWTNERNWETLEFGEVVQIISGHGFKLSEYSSSGVKLLQIANVSFQEIIWDNLAYLPIEYMDSYSNLVLQEGDLLMALNRPILGDRIKFAFLESEDAPSILYQRVGKFVIDKKRLHPSYLFGFMLTQYFYHELKNRLAGSDQPYINPTELVKMKFFLPPLALQEEFASVVTRVEGLRGRMSEAERQGEGLFESLLAESFA